MKHGIFINIILLLLFTAPWNAIHGQANCILQPPILHIDFGSSDRPIDPNLSMPENYRRVFSYCPQDGHYSIVSSTGDCFRGHWLTISQDHTPNDIDGKMLLVNAAYQPGLFLKTGLSGLSPNTTYELGAWLLNVCRPGADCTENLPNLRFVIENTAGIELAKFSTGPISLTGSTAWLQYSAMFTTPSDAATLFLKIINKEEGHCGNDFAMDDITIRECRLPTPVVKEIPRSKPVVTASPAFKTTRPVTSQVKKLVPLISNITAKDSPLIARQVIKERPVITLPKVILTRANPIVKQIETMASEIVIDLYDNGEIDGDTVSIYHNNVLVVSRAGLSAKPVTYRFTVEQAHPHHELVMVANNLGSIPPNTSLMIVTAKDKRYEVFISSSEQKNAKVVIDLKGP